VIRTTIALALLLTAETVSGQEFQPPDSNVPLFPRERTEIGHLAFSPDGKLLAGTTSGNGNASVVWEVATGKVVVRGTVTYGIAPAFHPDGRRLFIPEWDARKRKDGPVVAVGQVGRWDLREQEHLPPWTEDQLSIATMAISPDGRQLATGCCDVLQTRVATNRGAVVGGKRYEAAMTVPLVILRDPDTGKRTRVLRGPSLPPERDGSLPTLLTYSPDGKMLAARSIEDPFVNVWDPATGKLHRTLLVGEKLVDLRFTDRGEYLFAAFKSGAVLRWNLATGGVRVMLEEAEGPAPEAIRFGPNARFMVVVPSRHEEAGSGRVRDPLLPPVLWNLAAGKKDEAFRPELPKGTDIEDIAVSPDGKLLAIGVEKAVVLLELPAGKLVRTLRPGEPLRLKP